MESRFVSLDSKVEQFLNVETFLKHGFNTYKNAFYENMFTVAANIASSQTSLETSLVHQVTEHQLQIASDLDFVKLQLAELVNHLKEIGDAKKREGDKEVDQVKGKGQAIKRGKDQSAI
ncbi:auxin-responsive family protein [Dorcoceras hygrometricum]|uniref:Auxin-responsive family protein n=1 Tax=Dorcoceras hygrometricum TaxID=472368 RepID=A0A2Z7BN45_9LAMI|nr:auxin-responsive family protein [Dorcoceras hygrometricum]